MPFQEPERVDVDGIPVWFTDVPGPCMGGLVFRTGRIDETLVNAGINHIVEHLALYPFEPRRFDLNGTATELTTSFSANGTQEEVEAVLAEVCEHLGALPLDRLEFERRILETESRRRGGSFAGLASKRFGARGPGVVDYPEHTGSLTADVVGSWAAERFTAGQAVAWMTRPPSDRLRLVLPLGDRLPIPAAQPLPGLVTPSHVTSGGHYVGCSMFARRSLPMFIATQLFLARGFARLRTDLGLVYSVSQDTERISQYDSLYLLVCDTPEGEAARALAAFCDVLEELASGDLTEEEVRVTHDRAMPWNATDPARPAREAARKATACILGHDPTTWRELAEQGASLSPDAVHESMTDALDSAILALPEGLPFPDRFAAVPYEPVNRKRFGRLYVRWDGNPNDQVTVNQNGVTREVGRAITSAEFDDVEALVLGADGSIWLVRSDDASLLLQPNQLMRGRELALHVQTRLADRVVDLRGDAIAWFEMQSLLETHDTEVLRSIWQEIELLAKARLLHERVLAIAAADLDGHRGVFAVTDQRFLHIAAGRDDQVRWGHRHEIVNVETSTGIRGGRLRMQIGDGRHATIDRIRPRGHASELAGLLTPIDDKEG